MTKNAWRSKTGSPENGHFAYLSTGIQVAFASTSMEPPRNMDCPECAADVPPMAGSTWAIAWYSCGTCGTFWYARLRVGRAASEHSVAPMLTGRTQVAARDLWTLEELEAEADALRRESEALPKGNLEALRLHLEKLKVLADAINHRLDANAALTHRAS